MKRMFVWLAFVAIFATHAGAEQPKFGDFMGYDTYKTTAGQFKVAKAYGVFAKDAAMAEKAATYARAQEFPGESSEWNDRVCEMIQLPDGMWIFGDQGGLGKFRGGNIVHIGDYPDGHVYVITEGWIWKFDPRTPLEPESVLYLARHKPRTIRAPLRIQRNPEDAQVFRLSVDNQSVGTAIFEDGKWQLKFSGENVVKAN